MKAYTIYGEPVPKPRMTQRDKWAKRPCVLRYRMWADMVRATVGQAVPSAGHIHLVLRFYLPQPQKGKLVAQSIDMRTMNQFLGMLSKAGLK